MLKNPTVIDVSIVAFLLVSVLAINAFVYTGMMTMFPNASLTGDFSASEKQERNKAIPEKEISASTSVPAQQVIDSIMKKEVSSLNGWNGGKPNSGTPSSVFSWVCGKIEGKNVPYPAVANSKSYTKEARKNFTTVVAYAYGAGEGKTAVNKLQSQAKSCSGSAGLSDSDSPVDKSNGGFSAYYSNADSTVHVDTWAVGDVVMTVASTSRSQTSKVTKEYNDFVRGLLEPMCLALVSEAKDITRNPYVSGDSYTGWDKGRKVFLDKKVSGINPGYISKDGPISGKGYTLGFLPGENNAPVLEEIPGKKISYKNVKVPKAPLKPYPDILPDPVKKPLALPKAPKVPAESVTVAERVKDDKGPGCGWAFTNQAAPLFDDRAEKKAADEREAQAQDKMQSEQKQYYGQVADYVEAYEKYAISVEEYKDYYDEVEKVRDTWNDINQKRDAYRKKLDKYYSDLEDRENFFDRQKKAQEKYDNNLKICEAYEKDKNDYDKKINEDKKRYEREVKEWRDKKQKEADEEWENSQKDKDANDNNTDEGQDNNQNNNNADKGQDNNQNNNNADKGPKDYSKINPPASEVAPIGDGIEKPKPENGISCPVSKPSIIDQSPPAKPKVPKKPDVELPDAWNDIPQGG